MAVGEAPDDGAVSSWASWQSVQPATSAPWRTGRSRWQLALGGAVSVGELALGGAVSVAELALGGAVSVAELCYRCATGVAWFGEKWNEAVALAAGIRGLKIRVSAVRLRPLARKLLVPRGLERSCCGESEEVETQPLRGVVA